MKNYRAWSTGWQLLTGFVALFLAGISLRAAVAVDRQVINAGHGGDTTQDLLLRLESDVLAHAPDLVVLLVGTNDRLNSAKTVALGQYAENLRDLVQRITAKNIRLLLVTLPPAYSPYLIKRHPAEFYGPGGAESQVVAGNQVIHAVARERQLPVVELFEAFQKAGGATDQPASLIRNVANSGQEDGVHPTAAGYRLFAGLVHEAMERENLLTARRIICFGDSITYGIHMPGQGTAVGETYPAFLARLLDEKQPLPSIAP